MTTNFNSEVTQKIVKGLKLQGSAEDVPSRVGDVILPVFISNPDRLIRNESNAANDATSQDIMTTSSVKDTYLVGAEITISKSALATSIFSRLLFTPFGQPARNLLRIRYEPLTAGNFHANITFPFPIRLNRGSVISITNTTATASIDANGTVYFYETEGEE